MAGDVTEYEGTQITTVTIATGEATSAEIDIGASALFALETPSAFDSATISFKASHNTGGTFCDVYDDSGNEVKLTVATNEARMYTFNSVGAKMNPYKFIKLRCGSTATPATVASTRTLYIISKSGYYGCKHISQGCRWNSIRNCNYMPNICLRSVSSSCNFHFTRIKHKIY